MGFLRILVLNPRDNNNARVKRRFIVSSNTHTGSKPFTARNGRLGRHVPRVGYYKTENENLRHP